MCDKFDLPGEEISKNVGAAEDLSIELSEALVRENIARTPAHVGSKIVVQVREAEEELFIGRERAEKVAEIVNEDVRVIVGLGVKSNVCLLKMISPES